MHDVIVVGARCAGAPTAMLLARKGYKVLLVDRATFPSDIPHGHFIHRHGPGRLARWGLLDRLLADAAVEAGVELRTGFNVESLTTEGDRVTGVRGRTSHGTLAIEAA